MTLKSAGATWSKKASVKASFRTVPMSSTAIIADAEGGTDNGTYGWAAIQSENALLREPGEFARRFFHQLGDALGSIPTPPGAIVCCDEDSLLDDFGNDDLYSACAEICTMCGAPEDDCRCYDPHDDENTMGETPKGPYA